MTEIVVYTHSDCLLKDNGPNHPEKKERLEIVLKSIKEISSIDIDIKEAPLVDVEDIYLVHPEKHINNIFSLIPNSGLKGVEKEPYADTFLCPNSKNAILRSCGAGIAAADSLIKDNRKRIFCAVRPPGHHAETERANGFCFINNVAVTARYLQNKYQIQKIVIFSLCSIIIYCFSNVIYKSSLPHYIYVLIFCYAFCALWYIYYTSKRLMPKLN